LLIVKEDKSEPHLLVVKTYDGDCDFRRLLATSPWHSDWQKWLTKLQPKAERCAGWRVRPKIGRCGSLFCWQRIRQIWVSGPRGRRVGN
ncbi:hypothetical protein PanWU01x14_274610, partial [Parasponia andersonii]